MGIRKREITLAILSVAILFISGASTVFALKAVTAPSSEVAMTGTNSDRQQDQTVHAAKPGSSDNAATTAPASSRQTTSVQAQTAVRNNTEEVGITKARNGNTTIVTDGVGWLATFTDGARTVTIRGPQRTFIEPGVAVSVTHNVWVRLLDVPFNGVVDEAWLQSKQNDSTLDSLGVAMQYISGAPALIDASNHKYAGDADYGPLNPDGTRQEGSDFNDYLGIDYDYNGTTDGHESAQLGALDCSGYVRMVWGYRLGVKLTNQTDAGGGALPRRAVQMYASGPGVTLIAQGSSAQANLAKLQPGDLVFNDASTDDGAAIDHVGLYLGKDSGGNYRFISSRKTANGPTLSDAGGRSVLNGIGLYAKTFVAARRL